MRAIIQRVLNAKIEIEGREAKCIDKGFVVYLGVMEGDKKEQADYLCDKICGLRIFTDDNDKMNLSPTDISGDLLIVSNFTISANCRRGKRPSFELAAKPDVAETLYDYFVDKVKNHHGINKVETGVFGAHMEITSVADGPVNIIFDTQVISK